MLKAQKFIPLLLIAAGVLAYHNSFRCPFIFDDLHITEDPLIRQLWPPWPLLAHSSRPVVLLSLAANYALGGLNPLGYHIFNLAIHILAGLTLYGVVRRTLGSRTLSAKWVPAAAPVAATVAAIWLVHPLQTESVTYTIQRSESLMGLFYLLTLYCAIRSADSARARWWQLGAVASCALGMASKPVMVTAPVLVLLYDRVFLAQSWGEVERRRGMMYAGLAVTWLVLFVVLGNGQGEWKETAGFAAQGIAPARYALMQAGAILRYIRLAFWPGPLCLDYGWMYGGPRAETLQAALPALIVVGGLLGATVWALRRHPALGFLGVWFFLILAPTSSFIPLADPIFEHRMYLPLAAVVTMAVLATSVLCKRMQFGRTPGWILGGAVVLMLAGLTARRNVDYASELAIWQDTVNKSPNNPRAHNNLAISLGQAGRVGEAVKHYEQALRLKPDYAEAHNNLGVVLGRLGKPEEGIGHLREALRLAPSYVEAHYNLGIVLGESGRHEEAIGQFAEAVRIDPDYAKAQYNLGVALVRVGRVQEAIEQYEQTLRIQPELAEAHRSLGLALLEEGKTAEGIKHLQQAVQIKPDYIDALGDLGGALLQAGKPQEAISYLEQAVRVDPNSSVTQYKLGNALLQSGKARDAIRQYEQALRVNPNYIEAQNNLALALATLSPKDGGDPIRAVALAERACDATSHRVAACMDTLAAAYAAAGRFAEAIATAEQAIELARSAGQTQLQSQIEARLKSYLAGHDRREPVPAEGN